jgi:fumarate hydratase class II
MQANKEACEAAVEKSLAMVTSLNPYVGYKEAARLAKEAFASGKTIRQLCEEKQVLSPEQLKEALDPWKMTEPQA